MNLNFSPWGFLLVLGRTSALIAFFPMFAEAQIPRIARVGAALWVSLAIFPTLPVITYQPQSLPELAISVGLEAILGAFFALSARMVFAGIMLGAQWIDSEVGFQAAQQVNPFSGTPNSPYGTLILVASSLLFWCTGYFENLLLLWAHIFQVLPTPITHLAPNTGEALLNLSSQIFTRALEFTTPMLLVMFLVTIAIGLIARAVQGVNIFFETYNIKLIIGILTLASTAPLMMSLIQKQLEQIPESWMILLRALKS